MSFLSNTCTNSKALESDIILDIAAFHPESTLPATRKMNDSLVEKCKADLKWWKCGVPEYRRRRVNGETPFPRSACLQYASVFSIPSSERRHEISCRVFVPSAESQPPKGVLLHIHGGGWVLGSEAGQDLLLDEIANNTQLIVVSAGYRLAPEHPFPAARDDCCEVANWLLDNSEAKWGSPLKFISGESAGATLSTQVLLHLRNSGRVGSIAGIVLNYGCFDLSSLPAVRSLDPQRPLVLSYEDVEHFISAYLPGITPDERRKPEISPAYNDLRGLVPALFIVGTEDGLTDDTILMSGRWKVAGNETMVKFVPGAPHGFMTFDGNTTMVTRQGWDVMIQFLNSKV